MQRAAATFAVICVIASFMLLLVFVVGSIKRGNTALPRNGGFCCADELDIMATLVNVNVDPCENFHNFVCPAQTGSIWTAEYVNLSSYINDVIQGGETGGKVAELLADFYISCWNAVRDPTLMTRQLAAMTIIAGNLTVKMNTSEVEKFAAFMSLVIGTSSVLSVSIHSNNSRQKGAGNKVMIIGPNDVPVPSLVSRCKHCLFDILEVFNNLLNVKVQLEDVLCYMNSSTATTRQCSPSNKAASSHNTSLLLEFLRPITADHWKSLLKEYTPYNLNASLSVGYTDEERLKSTLHSLANPANQPTSIAYLLVVTVEHLYANLTRKENASREEAHFQCIENTNLLPTFWGALYGKAMATPAKDKHVRRVSKKVLNALLLEAVPNTTDRHKTASANAWRALRGFKLLLPSNFPSYSHAWPAMTRNFAENFFRGKLYELNLAQACVGQRLPLARRHFLSPDVKLDDGFIVIPAALYSQLAFDSAHSFFLNLPVVGVAVAELLWRVVLKSTRSLISTKRLLKCFEKGYPNAADSTHDDIGVVPLAMALSTVLKIVDKSNWQQRKRYSKAGNWSKGELFYARAAHSICTSERSKLGQERINVVFRHQSDFSTSFACPSNFNMSRRRSCPYITFY